MDRSLSDLCLERKSFYTDDIADIDMFLENGIIQCFVLTGTKVVASYIDLNSSRRILKFGKRRRAHDAPTHDPSRERNLFKIFLLRIELLLDLARCYINLKELGRVRIDSKFFQLLLALPAYNFLFT